MDREILFRGKRKSNGEWIEGCLVISEGQCLISHGKTITLDNMINWTWYEVDPETVCQYTGLTDKNGRKIFEGNIVSFLDTYSTGNGYAESYCVGKVVWDEEEVCFHVTERLSAESWEVLNECCVIGNVFDNKELLEGDAE